MDLWFEENAYWAQDYCRVAGVDEVGRGCLAGPVFAAAVVFEKEIQIPHLNDSKKLSSKRREELSKIILNQSLSYCISKVSVQEIDQINILNASLKAMQLALAGLSEACDMVLVDGKVKVPGLPFQKTMVKGDSRSASIAAASIIAKVARDQFMAQQEKRFPDFSFSAHKGYGTKAHLKELTHFGPTPLHRKSFAPVKDLIKKKSLSQ